VANSVNDRIIPIRLGDRPNRPRQGANSGLSSPALGVVVPVVSGECVVVPLCSRGEVLDRSLHPLTVT
jgi:hypothetical protein